MLSFLKIHFSPFYIDSFSGFIFQLLSRENVFLRTANTHVVHPRINEPTPAAWWREWWWASCASPLWPAWIIVESQSFDCSNYHSYNLVTWIVAYTPSFDSLDIFPHTILLNIPMSFHSLLVVNSQFVFIQSLDIWPVDDLCHEIGIDPILTNHISFTRNRIPASTLNQSSYTTWTICSSHSQSQCLHPFLHSIIRPTHKQTPTIHCGLSQATVKLAESSLPAFLPNPLPRRKLPSLRGRSHAIEPHAWDSSHN
jgi:hypothetical protein